MFVVSVEDDIMVRVETGAWRRPTSAILWPDIWDISAKIKAPHMRSKSQQNSDAIVEHLRCSYHCLLK